MDPKSTKLSEKELLEKLLAIQVINSRLLFRIDRGISRLIDLRDEEFNYVEGSETNISHYQNVLTKRIQNLRKDVNWIK